MKVASMARVPQQPEEDPTTTEDKFPPEEGEYIVSSDFDLLNAGYDVVSTHRTDTGAIRYHCIPRDFPRCKVIAYSGATPTTD